MNRTTLEVKPQVTELVVNPGTDQTVLEVHAKTVQLLTVGIQGPAGPAGSGESAHVVFPFAYNNVATQVIYTFTQNARVFGIRAEVFTVFNATGALIEVSEVQSVSPILLAPDEIDLSQVMVMDKNMAVPFVTGEQIRLFITLGVGGTQGSGEIVLEVG